MPGWSRAYKIICPRLRAYNFICPAGAGHIKLYALARAYKIIFFAWSTQNHDSV